MYIHLYKKLLYCIYKLLHKTGTHDISLFEMPFHAKPFKLGNSYAIYLPKDIYMRLQPGASYEFWLQGFGQPDLDPRTLQ